MSKEKEEKNEKDELLALKVYNSPSSKLAKIDRHKINILQSNCSSKEIYLWVNF